MVLFTYILYFHDTINLKYEGSFSRIERFKSIFLNLEGFSMPNLAKYTH